MEPNPYESPQVPGEPPAPKAPRRWLRPKPLWGYPVAVIVGAIVIGSLLNAWLAVVDDAGGLQMLTGGFLGLVIYGLLF